MLGTVAWAVVPQSSAGVARDGRELMMGRAAARPFYVHRAVPVSPRSAPPAATFRVPCPGTAAALYGLRRCPGAALDNGHPLGHPWPRVAQGVTRAWPMRNRGLAARRQSKIGVRGLDEVSLRRW